MVGPDLLCTVPPIPQPVPPSTTRFPVAQPMGWVVGLAHKGMGPRGAPWEMTVKGTGVSGREA